jgi:CxxC motif-containing protein (DUF1111 family)
VTVIAAVVLSSLSACAPPPEVEPGAGGAGGADGAVDSLPQGDPYDVVLAGADAAEEKTFFDGDRLFGMPLHEADGLGPLYTRSACGACHTSGLRGPGSVQKMAVVLADGVTTDPDQSRLAWGNTVHPLLAAGATTPIEPPDDPRVKVSIRVGPPILGRGYLEAIDDAAILAAAAAQAGRDDGIHGRVNHVVYASEPNPDPTFNAHQKGDLVIGRFGLKARIATLDEFTADALQGDMGITSPLRPTEIRNPDGLTDDGKPGVDVTAESVNRRAMYMRLTAIPRRDGLTDAGRAFFAEARCDVCHAPSLPTRADYPIALLAGIDAPVFTDMLLHDLGDTLADGVVDGQAGSRDWRTAPLLGLRFDKTFLHDGRAATVEQAILQHDGPGSEAHDSIARFRGLAGADRELLLAFVGAL